MNEERFNNKGVVYNRARPQYTKECIDWIVSELNINTHSVIADIGSGTGIFTMQLAPFVKKIYAVEPNDNMREQAEQHFRARSHIFSVTGTAENTTLPDKSVDSISVAQAFHWFDRAKFKAESQRILKDNGKVVLVWNDRDTSSAIIQQNYEINHIYCPQFKGASAGISFVPSTFNDYFSNSCILQTFQNHLAYNREMFIERNLSSSYAPTRYDNSFKKYIQALNRLFDNYAVNGKINYPYITRVYIGNV